MAPQTTPTTQTPELLADYACVCGEGPSWHPLEKRLYWTDIETGRLFWYDPATGKHQPCYQGPRVGGFTIQSDGSLLLFRDKGNVVVWREGRVLDTVIDAIAAEAHGRFNDVIADPQGRVYAGTLLEGGRPGRLYRLDRTGKLTQMLDGLGCANGMGFSPDRKIFYFTDTAAGSIDAFDYESGSGALTRRQVLIQVAPTPGQGAPDGLTVDAAGHIWSARWGGSCVLRYGPEGREKQRITLPARKITSICFGGENYRDLYVTSAGGDQKATDGPAAGGLFRFAGIGQGVSEFFSRVGLAD